MLSYTQKLIYPYNNCLLYIGLKQKFSYSHFRENFAKILFSLFAKKSYKNIQKLRKLMGKFSRERKLKRKIFAKTNFCENFRENEIVYEHLCKKFTFWYNHIFTRLFHNFWQKFSRQFLRKLKVMHKCSQKFSWNRKFLRKTKIFAKRNFAKIISFSHDFRFSRK
jgi:hypothetical protein